MMFFCLLYGVYNEQIDVVMVKQNLVMVNWIVDFNDWQNCNVGKIIKMVIEYVMIYIQLIIVLYDIYLLIVDVISGIIEVFCYKGMIFVIVFELIVNIGGFEIGKVYCCGIVVNQNGFGCYN